MGILDVITGPILHIIDKVIPDPAQRDQAKLAFMQAQQNGELDELKTQLSAIMAEEQSADPWTSRARPSFLYVIYLLILAAIPMGVVTALYPVTAAAITVGFRAWLSAIPDQFVQLFGLGYLGYVGGRSFDKWKSGAQ